MINRSIYSPALVGLLVGSVGALQAAPLEEIVVTAEFRPVNLLQQPASTSVVSMTEIRQRAAQHLEEILNLTPNVNYAGGSSRARFYQIRGIGERSQFQEPLNPSVGLLIDGVDFSGLGTAGNLFDVEQVEVLRGPQGTIHGANALAGLISINSAEPAAEPGFRLDASAGNYDTFSAGVMATGPLASDSLLYRVAAHHYRSDGFIDNDFLHRHNTQDRDESGARAKLRWLASELSTLDLTLFYTDINNGYDAFSLDNSRHTLSDEPGHDRQKSTAAALDWRNQLRAVDLETTLTWAYSDTEYSYDEDWTYVGIAPGWEYSSFDRYDRDRDSYSAQLRLLSNDSSSLLDGRSDWVMGLYYLGNRERLKRHYTYLDGPFDSHYDTDTYAVFGELDTRLGHRLELSTGLRLEQRQTDYRDSNQVEDKPDKDLWGGRVVLEYHLSDDQMLYGGVSRGYRANGVNADVLASMSTIDDPALVDHLRSVQSYDAEYLINYETGFKGDFLNRSLRTRLALFYMDRHDQQVKGSLVFQREDNSTTFIDHTNNAASGDNYGMELEIEWQPTQDLYLYSHLGLLRAEFDRYINADGTDLSGRDQAQAPHYQYAVGGRYEIGGGFYARVDVEGKDSFYFSDRHNLQAPSYNLLHARIAYLHNRWHLALWGRNLTDENYYVRGFGSFGNDPRKEYVVEPYYQYGDPRQVGVSVSYSL